MFFFNLNSYSLFIIYFKSFLNKDFTSDFKYNLELINYKKIPIDSYLIKNNKNHLIIKNILKSSSSKI